MNIKTQLAALGLSMTLANGVAHANSLQLNPSDDGSLYTCQGCNLVNDSSYLLVSGYIWGDTKFPTAQITSNIASATFTVNPYGLPLFGPDVMIYGYGSSIGQLASSDYTPGTYLGTLVLPTNLGYGQDASFDVTAFVRQFVAQGGYPYIGFILQSTGTDVFSSTHINYGHPDQLTIDFSSGVPEPSAWTLMLCGATVLGGLIRRTRRTTRMSGGSNLRDGLT